MLILCVNEYLYNFIWLRETMVLLSKSSYITGLQCHKYLWISFHQKDLIPEHDAGAKHKFEQGHIIGSMAKELFPKGIDIAPFGIDKNVSDTKTLLSKRVPLFEAGFQSGNVYSRVDILCPAGRDKWDILEVKSSTDVKEVYLHDVSFQKYCCEKAGLKIRKCFVLHVNNKYVRRGKLNSKKFFVKKDVTSDVDVLMPTVESNIIKMFETLALSSCPKISIGDYCSKPYECPLTEHCWGFLPEHNVFELYRGGKKSFELFNQGILTIKDIPDTFELSDKQMIQKKCELNGEVHIVKNEIKKFLSLIKYPVYFMDFETINPAIPLFDKLKPYQRIPFQFSIHIQESPNSEIKHLSYITDGKHDPRTEFLDELKKGLGTTGTIIVHNQVFEKGMLKELGEAFPKYKKWVEHTNERILDELIPFSNFHYYNRKQKGSASIKNILPALTPKSHKELEITNGEDASLTFLDITYGDVTPEYRQKKRKELERYCGLDTEAMIHIIDKLRKDVS